jgi:hypothetical protein
MGRAKRPKQVISHQPPIGQGPAVIRVGILSLKGPGGAAVGTLQSTRNEIIAPRNKKMVLWDVVDTALQV